MALLSNYPTTTSSGDPTLRTEIKSLHGFPGKVHCSGLCLEVHEDAQKSPQGFFFLLLTAIRMSMISPSGNAWIYHSAPVVMLLIMGFQGFCLGYCLARLKNGGLLAYERL